jgi:hypothetical protein
VIVVARTNPTQGVPIYEDKAPLLHTLRFSSDEEKARFEAAYREMAEAN